MMAPEKLAPAVLQAKENGNSLPPTQVSSRRKAYRVKTLTLKSKRPWRLSTPPGARRMAPTLAHRATAVSDSSRERIVFRPRSKVTRSGARFGVSSKWKMYRAKNSPTLERMRRHTRRNATIRGRPWKATRRRTRRETTKSPRTPDYKTRAGWTCEMTARANRLARWHHERQRDKNNSITTAKCSAIRTNTSSELAVGPAMSKKKSHQRKRRAHRIKEPTPTRCAVSS
mmetsp:Transcript_38110/g.113869  ORF Transcript_38110/g.113869 Transcript_38110/m.113869 type:complete len:228 (-) Transcript_38110:251-934(-)